MICTIEWNHFSPKEWQERYKKIRRANLLQSYDYAKAYCAANQQTARWGLIRIDSQDAGLVQIIESGLLGNALHAVTLDCGPLWFEGFGSLDHFEAFFTALNKNFPRRLGRMRRIIPEIPETKNTQNILQDIGYKKRLKNLEYQTIWLNLDKKSDVLRAGLKGNWRNKLKKAEKAGLQTEWDDKGLYFSWLLKIYTLDRGKRGYDGPSPKFLNALAQAFSPEGNMLIGRIILDGKAIAAILVLCHGASATYQISWSSDQGRKVAAHHLLLWDAVRILKERGIHDFDLGGVNDGSASGVKTFKEGFGGELVRLSGLYR